MQLAGQSRPSRSYPQRLQLANARKLCSPAWWHPGRRACAARSAPAQAPPAPVALASDQGANAARRQRRGKPPALNARRLGAAAARRGARASRSKLQGSRVRPSLANTEPAPPRAQPRPPPLSRPYAHLDGCGRRRCPRSWPLGLAACARCGRFAPSLHPWPLCARTGIERRRRRGRCAPGTAGQGVCRACLPRARAALAACRHPCAPGICDKRDRAAHGAPALGGHPHARCPMASSGARRRGGRCPGLPVSTRLRRLPTSMALFSRGALSASVRASAAPRA
jgi:hypothetical protein